MGFEQLAALREQLRADVSKKRAAMPEIRGDAPERSRADAGLEAIWRLQRYFPKAFPKAPASKVPLKQGILDDLKHHLERLKLSDEELRQAVSTWCTGSRYWACLTEGATRVDLLGNFEGEVTADQARFARACAAKSRGQAKAKARTNGNARLAPLAATKV